MLRLPSWAFASKLRTLRKLSLLALGLVAVSGCAPKAEDPAASRPATPSTSQPETDHSSPPLSAAPTTAQSDSDANLNESITSKEKTPQPADGQIPVNDEGFVVLDSAAGTANKDSSASTSEPDAAALGEPIDETSPSTKLQETESSRGTAASTVSALLPLELGAEANEPAAVPEKAEPATENSSSDSVSLSSSSEKAKPDQHKAESGVASYDEKHQKIAEGWPKPQALLFITGQQHGYIEPCGCTGLENQKGGLNRRDTLLQQLSRRGWDIVPMDVGNFERRAGRQAEIKFQTTVEALKDMGYRAATLGVDDLKLSSTHLLSLTATEGKTETPFISSNAYILVDEYMPKSKIIEAGGRKIGITAVLGDSYRAALSANSDVITSDAAASLKAVVAELKKANCDYLILLAHATFKESQQLAVDVPGFDLVATSGDFPEPFYQLEDIPGSSARIAQVGAKGMYTVLIGLYPESDQPVRYQRVALSSQFADSPRMLERFANYQKQLESLGFEGLGLRASTPPEGRKFVGSETCGNCHTKAFEVWKASEHFTATESLVHPPNDRSMIPRHFDPECLSCHVTGWNAKSYFPYASGYTSLKETPMLTGSGCENCHGPGSKHVAAENGEVDVDDELLKELRAQMRLPLAEAKNRCLDCHDQDNSPEFQHEGAFEAYWEQIAHPGKD